MSLLAEAGIYLVLDVNSPLEGQHLNRYEPWTTYTERYVTHVFNVINEFSGYNNTLAFFAGNEIVNDQISALNSPVYIKATIRDMKLFMKENRIRKIPVGYSAADDLSFRISLAEYLECYESDILETVDFYGVNTYQWCGEQTFTSSGYNTLVKDYASYSKPIFFSEYGCNEVLPRLFKEVEAIYSSQMTDVFSGGLVYEFAQEPNNYGLVDYDESGNVILLPDFFAFKEQISNVQDVQLSKKLKIQNQNSLNPKNKIKNNSPKLCDLEYANLDISKGVPRSVGASIAKSFSAKSKGKFAVLNQEEMISHFKVFSSNGQLITDQLVVKSVPEPTGDPEDLISCEYKTDQLIDVQPIKPDPSPFPNPDLIPIGETPLHEKENGKNERINKDELESDKSLDETKDNENDIENDIENEFPKRLKNLESRKSKIRNELNKIRKSRMTKAKLLKVKMNHKVFKKKY